MQKYITTLSLIHIYTYSVLIKEKSVCLFQRLSKKDTWMCPISRGGVSFLFIHLLSERFMRGDMHKFMARSGMQTFPFAFVASVDLAVCTI